MALFNRYQLPLTLLLITLGTVTTRGERVTKFKRVSLDPADLEVSDTLPTAQLIELRDEPTVVRPQLNNTNSGYTPILFWHGMGDTAYGSIDIERKSLQRLFPGVTVVSVQIGSNALEDRMAGYFSNANSQIEQVCKLVLSNPTIRAHGSFNAVGFSQGAQFVRGLIQRCPFQENGIRVKNFISLGGQHQGVFGLPNCMLKGYCDLIDHLLSVGAYEQKVQTSLVQAAYWHDPTKEGVYRRSSIFIGELNNERGFNQTYASNLQQLDSMVLVQFQSDHSVIPRESSLFGFYASGSTSRVIPAEQTRQWLRLGLHQLDKLNRLHRIIVPGDHLQYKMSWFNDQIARVYLDN